MRSQWLGVVLVSGIVAASCGQSPGEDPDAGDVGGGVGGGSGGGATGGGSGGGGGSAMPLTINLNYQSQCPAINPQCGGDLVGRWFYTAACVDGSLLSQALTSCPAATISNITGTTKGDITFSTSTVTRIVTTSVTGTLEVPTSCAVAGCPAIQTALDTLYDSATCTQSGTGCSCTISNTLNISDTAAYTASNGIVLVNGGALTYAFCRTGDSMVYRQTSTPMSEPGTLTLQKQ